MKTIAQLLCLFAGILLAHASAHAKDHPYSDAFVNQVRTLFYENGVPSRPKIDAYIRRLQQKRTEMIQLAEQREMRDGNADRDEAEDEAYGHKFTQFLDDAITRLDQLQSARSEADLLKEAKYIFDVEAAIRFQGARGNLLFFLEQAKNMLVRWQAKKNAPASAQASNLYLNGKYLSVADVQAYRAAGGDISLLNPGPESTFWEKPPVISQVDVKDAARGKLLKFYDGIKGKFPDEDVYFYDEVKPSDTKPKIDVYYLDEEGKKVKFKAKFGGEIHSDPTTAALTMTLGYPADLVKHVKNIRINLGKKRTLSDLKLEWESYYRRDNTRRNNKIEHFIKESGTDPDGNNYVVFYEGLLEAKPKKVTRLGGWRFGDNGHQDLRELRGLTVVQMWLNNIDMKEFDNNRLLMTENGRAHIISDLGASLGGLFFEKPEIFPTSMIAATSPSAVTMRYRTFQENSVKPKLTYEDARWASKLIAQVTRPQIRKAVELGKWPACIADIYVEKLIERRNSLVRAFKLEGVKGDDGAPIALMPVDLSPERINYDVACNNREIESEYTSSFDYDLGFLLKPIGKSALNALMDLARSSLGSARHITLNHVELGLQTGKIAQVILNVQRTYEKNPNPTSEQDLFIFQDHLEIGLRLGYSVGVFKDATYIRKFTVSYPMRSIEDGRLKDNFIANVLLPLDIAHNKLPEKYVLMTEHYLEHGAGLEFDRYEAPVSPTVRAKAARVLLLRSFIDHRDPDNYIVFRDRARYNELSLRVFARVSLLRLPLFNTLRQWGTTSGVGARLTKELAHAPDLSQKINRAMLDGDFRGLRETEQRFRVATSFRGASRGWDFLFWNGRQSGRYDRLTVTDEDSGEAREALQYREVRGYSHSYFWKETESRDVAVEVYANPEGQEQNLQVDVDVSYADTRTTDAEMQHSYLRFINGLSTNNLPLIPLSVELGYSTNRRWGSTIIETRTSYYEDGLKRLLAVSREDFFNELKSVELSSPSMNAVEQRTLQSKSRMVWKLIENARRPRALGDRLKAVAKIFSKSIYRSRGFYEVRLLGTINRLIGRGNLYTEAEVRAPDFVEQNFLDDAPLFGSQGVERSANRDFLIYVPTTANELYSMFDFLNPVPELEAAN